LKIQEILQINATVIAGVLVLLTITFATHTNGSIMEKILSIGVWAIILPFAGSSIRALQVEMRRLHGEEINEINNRDLIRSVDLMR
jgi:predicted permease